MAKTIGLFDSGLGGLTVLKQARARCPENNYIYFGDQARAPYGELQPETLASYSREVLAFLGNQQVDQVLVACNTVSSNCLDQLQLESSLPLVGTIEPTAKKYGEKEARKIGILSTKKTCESGAFPRAIDHYAQASHEIYSSYSSEIVPAIEEAGLIWPRDQEAILDILRPLLADWQDQDLDELILACTHFPLWEEAFGQLLPEVDIIDPALAMVEEMTCDPEPKGQSGQIWIFSSGEEGQIRPMVELLFPQDLGDIHIQAPFKI